MDALPQLSSVPGGVGTWCKADVTMLQPALEGPPGTALASGAGDGPALPSYLGPRTAPVSSDPPHQDVLHILIKVLPWTGRASDRWLQSELQGCSGIKHGIRLCTPVLENTLAPTLEVGPLGLQEERQTWQAVGRWQVPPGVAKAGLRDGRRVQVGKCCGWFLRASWLVSCG